MSAESEGEASVQEGVRAIYDGSWPLYRLTWAHGRSLAQHFGYWDAATRTHGASLLLMNQVMADLVQVRPGDRVLDAGCGVGGSALWLAEHRSVEVVGINIAATQIRQANRYARARDLAGRVRFEVRDFLASGYDDASFDVVWAQESMGHAVSQQRFASEMFRLLKPGGRLVIEDPCLLSQGLTPESVDDLRSFREDCVYPEVRTAKELAELLATAGFVGVHNLDVTARAMPSYRRMVRIERCFKWSMAPLGILSSTVGRQRRMIRGLLALERLLRRGDAALVLTRAVKPAA